MRQRQAAQNKKARLPPTCRNWLQRGPKLGSDRLRRVLPGKLNPGAENRALLTNLRAALVLQQYRVGASPSPKATPENWLRLEIYTLFLPVRRARC